MTRETKAHPLPGVIGVLIVLGLVALAAFFVMAPGAGSMGVRIFMVALLITAASVSLNGFFIVQPNQAEVIILLGKYIGSVHDAGWWWTNPLASKKKLSLRVRSLNGEKLKVNDKDGNPVEIAAVVVWRVRDSAQAVFDVDTYEQFVAVQSETAVRHLASQFTYDAHDDETISLRGNMDQISEALRAELQVRLDKAGVEILESRLSHLAYGAEIASAMLRRQQAGAVVAARTRIVEGAVGMVEMALERLSAKGIVHLDEEKKAAMVSNLLVVLCGEQAASPVINAGTLHQ
jgi:regulator of protease activity HflC (stomatin/prohibitin superfamily)